MGLAVSPELAGFSSARLRWLTAALQGYIEKGLFPGVSVIVARCGQVV